MPYRRGYTLTAVAVFLLFLLLSAPAAYPAGQDMKSLVESDFSDATSRETVTGPVPDSGAGNASADPLDNWTWRNPLPQGNALLGVCYGNSIFVALGENGTILTSPDGVVWSKRAFQGVAALKGAVYASGTFVVVGYENGLRKSVVLTSPDGINWTRRESPEEVYLNAVAFGNHTFVAVGRYGAVLTSSNAVTWTRRTTEAYEDLNSICYGNGTFLAVGTSDAILTSPDGVVWKQRPSGTGFSLGGVTYVNKSFVAVGWDYQYPVFRSIIFTSPNGTTWTERDRRTGAALQSIAYGNSTFVAVGYESTDGVKTGFVLTSPDGKRWTKRTSINQSLAAVAYGNSTFVAVGLEKWGIMGAVLTSANGASWIGRSSGFTHNLQSLAFGNNIFVAVGDQSAIFSSPDGVTWTKRTTPGNVLIYSVVFGGNTFVALGIELVSYTRGPHVIFTSSDGIKWTRSLSGIPYGMNAVTYGKNTFVIVGEDIIFTSQDGKKWTKRNSGPWVGLDAVTYGNNTFVAVGWSGRTATSSDGIKWTIRDGEPRASFFSVTYGNNTFVAIGSLSDIAFFLSADGITWTESPKEANNNVHGIAFGGNTFVTLGYEGSLGEGTGFILTSPDGLEWTRRTLGVTASLNGVAFADNSFIVVGNGGTILQSGPLGTTFLLSVSKSGTGSGTVTSVPSGIDCGATCSHSFNGGKKVTLTATPAASSTFSGWSGACTGKGATCTVTVGSAKDVTAAFAIKQFKVTASVSGGHGAVSPAAQTVNYGNTVSLAVTPASGYHIASITDNKVSKPLSNPYKMENVTAAHTVVVTFSSKYALTVSKAGTGRGTVTSVPAGIRCGATCTGSFTQGETVTLTAVPQARFVFTGWSGACSGTGQCIVTMDGAKGVTATFGVKQAENGAEALRGDGLERMADKAVKDDTRRLYN